MERSERFSIALACGLGALIGSSLMLSIGNPFFTTLGAILGGLVGYLSYRPFEVIQAVIDVFNSIPWKEKYQDALPGLKLFGIVIVFLPTMFVSGVFSFWLGEFMFGEEFMINESAPTSVQQYRMIIFFEILIGMILGVMSLEYSKDTNDTASAFKFLFVSVLLPSPLGTLAVILAVVCGILYCIWFFLTRILPMLYRGLVTGCKCIPGIIIFLAMFCWQVFVRIHSDRRLMCLTDAATGSLIGYCAGSAIIGCISGALIGLLNYEVISKRLLKLVPLSSHS